MAEESGQISRRHPLGVIIAHGGFRALWAGSVLFYLALAAEQVAVGWLVLDETGSAFLTALAFAVRVAPDMVLGPVAGAYADQHGRRGLLVSAGLLKSAALFLTTGLVLWQAGAIAPLLALVMVSGASLTLHTVAFGAVVPELVESSSVLTATSVSKLGHLGIGVVGALGAGFLIASSGLETVFALAAGAALAAAVFLARVPQARVPARSADAPPGLELREGLASVLRLPVVAAVLAITAAVEIFGFSFLALLPVLAQETLKVGPEGLGGLSAASFAGAVAGTALLVRLGDFRRAGALLLACVFGFGVLLVLLGASDVYAASLVLVFGVSILAAAVDTLEWALLQAETPARLRGRAFGLWSAVAGFGWVGPLTLGALAGVWNVQAALALSGGVLALAGIAGFAASQKLRSA